MSKQTRYLIQYNVDVVTDANELTMPLTIMPARAYGFALSKVKEFAVESSV